MNKQKIISVRMTAKSTSDLATLRKNWPAVSRSEAPTDSEIIRFALRQAVEVEALLAKRAEIKLRLGPLPAK